MSLATLFGFRTTSSSGSELPDIFPLTVSVEDFIHIDVVSIYSRILTDCIERIQGIPEDVQPLLWDNFLQNQSPKGLVTLLAEAMANKDDLFLVYIQSLQVLRLATPEEEKSIEQEYDKNGFSDTGLFISFENFQRSDMIKLYSAMEYCVVGSLNKMANLSKAIQFKMSEMRGSVSLADSSVAIDQAIDIALSLKSGRDVLIDKNDEIVTNAPDISAVKESIAFLDSKKSFYYGMPLSYINGEQTPGIGSTGEADTKAVERGLKQYFISILKPILDDLFDIRVTFKSNDFRQMSSALEAIKTFELVSDELISRENKQVIIQRLFDLETETE